MSEESSTVKILTLIEQSELAGLQAENAAMRGKLNQLRAELEAANAARDDWRERYESVWLGDESDRKTQPSTKEKS